LDLESCLEKNNRWSMLVQDSRLSVEVGARSLSTEVRKWTGQGTISSN